MGRAAALPIIQGDTSLILVDLLVTAEMSRMALNLYYDHFSRQPIPIPIAMPITLVE